jgi:lipid-A-disaccharide synthase
MLAVHGMAARARICGDSRTVMRSADLALVASGTASLETALVGTPMVIVYKVSPITNLTARLAVRIGWVEKYVVGLPNLILGYSAVPEVLQERATPALLAEEAWTLLSSDGRRQAMRSAFLSLGERLHGSRPVSDAADIVLKWAHRRAAGVARSSNWSAAQEPVWGAVKRE